MATTRIGGRSVALSHLDRVLYPDDGITKGDVIAYYRAVAPAMLPYLARRPLHLQRYPHGIDAPGFVQKAAGPGWPDWIARAEVRKEGGTVVHAVCDDEATLVFLANQDCLTLHPWLSRADEPRRPDRVVFDLDPPGDDFAAARHAALRLRALLDEAGLPAFLMSTGSRGLHVVMPLVRGADYDDVRDFGDGVAGRLVERDPQHLTAEQRKHDRGARLYVDTMRNAYAQTAVAPYSLRARKGAPVATPLDWEELADPALTARTYTLRSVPARLHAMGDPWRGMARSAVTLADARRRVGMR